MAIDVKAAERTLSEMTVPHLRLRYAELFGEETRTHHKRHLVKSILWRMQVVREGDLSDRARQRARELASDADLRLGPPPKRTYTEAASGNPGDETVVHERLEALGDERLPAPGTLLRREYKGRSVLVRVLPKGFEYDGEVYRSLSAIATRITGSHWNGYRFFGLHKPGNGKGDDA